MILINIRNMPSFLCLLQSTKTLSFPVYPSSAYFLPSQFAASWHSLTLSSSSFPPHPPLPPPLPPAPSPPPSPPPPPPAKYKCRVVFIPDILRLVTYCIIYTSSSRRKHDPHGLWTHAHTHARSYIPKHTYTYIHKHL